MMSSARKRRKCRVDSQVCDVAIVLARVHQYKIEQSTDRECSPGAEVVIHVYLSDRRPLKVGSHGVHLALFESNTPSSILNVMLGRA